MSLAHVERPVETAAAAFDQQAWLDWLTANTDPNWRPGEWDPENWLFTGDPDRAETAVWRCPNTGCHVAARANGHLCRTCYEQFEASGLSREEFLKTGKRQIRATPGSPATCVAVVAGQRCIRDASTRGACVPHYRQWIYHFKIGRTKLQVEQWIEQEPGPVPAPAPCPIGACPNFVIGSRVGLCAYHRDRWKRFRIARGLREWGPADLDSGWPPSRRG